MSTVFDTVAELRPLPDTVAVMVTLSLSFAIMFSTAIPSLLVISSFDFTSPPSVSHSTINPSKATVISGIVIDNLASILSFQFRPPRRSNDGTGVISTTLMSYFVKEKSSESSASSISPSLIASSSNVVK